MNYGRDNHEVGEACPRWILIVIYNYLKEARIGKPVAGSILQAELQSFDNAVEIRASIKVFDLTIIFGFWLSVIFGCDHY